MNCLPHGGLKLNSPLQGCAPLLTGSECDEWAFKMSLPSLPEIGLFRLFLSLLPFLTRPQLGPIFVLKFVRSRVFGRDFFNRFQSP